ncbi:ALF repeat-containing protein, partial [Streptomyces sp. SID1034]
MDTTFWSRRRVLGALAATTVVAATSSLVLNPIAARADTPPPDGDDGDPFNLPDTDRAKAVKAWLLGGNATRAAAEAALIGSDAEVTAFLTDELPKVTAEDNRVAVLTSLAGGGKGTRRDAGAAIEGGDTAIAAYLAGGFKPAITEDLQVATAAVIATGGKAVARDGNAALTAGTQKALADFLTQGQYTARLEDMRFEVSQLSVQAGPEVRKYASRALDG